MLRKIFCEIDDFMREFDMCDIEHTRHRSPINFMVNMLAGLIRYTYFEKKTSINFTQKDRNLLHLAIAYTSKNNDFMGLERI